MADKRQPLSIENRVEVIELSRAGKSEREIALEVGSRKGQVGRIFREQCDKIEILKDEEGKIPDNLKRKLVEIRPKYTEIEEVCMQFVERAREWDPGNGTMLRSLAKREANNCNKCPGHGIQGCESFIFPQEHNFLHPDV